jgi:4-amino-4-deoxy-L-arabinose transferase-like glycosyltransferase
MTPRDTILRFRMEILLLAILVLSGSLNLWNIWNLGWSNTYYAAAVRSMLENPAAGFFNSFDPAGFITVDKPPVGLWVQAFSAAILGFSGSALILPQAFTGIGSVALIYLIVSRSFGKPAGLVAALALAVTPISVAVSRNGTMDMQMIFVILLAVWAVLRAARERSLFWLLVSVVLVGIGFNIKMIQAFIVVPAILAVYVMGTTGGAWKKRALHAAMAVAVLLAVSLSWAVTVDLIPADQRPFIGGSGDNTVMGLIINYNGAHRLGISETGGSPGNGSFGPSAGGAPGQGWGNGTTTAPDRAGPSLPGQDSGPSMPGGSPFAGPGNSAGTSGIFSAPGGDLRGGGGMNGNGSPGIFRVFANDLAGDIAWLLMFALIGILAWVRKPRTFSIEGFEEAGYLGEKGLTLLVMLLWLIPGLLYFSFTTGFWHDYYIATIAPPLAALVGIGAAGTYREYVSGSRAGWLLVIAVLVTGLLQVYFLSGDAGFAGSLVPLIAAGTLAGAGLLALMKVRKTGMRKKHRRYIIVVAIAFLFIAPLVWSCTLLAGNSGNLPTAGLSDSRGGTGSSSFTDMGGLQPPVRGLNGTRFSDRDSMDRSGMGTGPTGTAASGGFSGNRTSGGPAMDGGPGGFTGSDESGRLSEYLLAHSSGETWILAVPSSHTAANLIIGTGKPVMCLGGFTGSDQVLNVTALRHYISQGKVRYFLGSASGDGGGDTGSGNAALFSWVSGHCTEVAAAEWGRSTSPGTSARSGAGHDGAADTLYDCAGIVQGTSS